MRAIVHGLLVFVTLALLGCVTINVYFPEAAAKKAADQFIDTVIDTPATAPKKASPPASQGSGGGMAQWRPAERLLDLLVPSAQAADTPDIRIQTAASEAIRQRMRERFQNVLTPAFNAGAIGFTADGLVAVRDAGKLPLEQRSAVNAAVADENRDRLALYREIAQANGHPEWAGQIQATFAQGWIQRAAPGWYYQQPGGAWKQK